MFIKILGLRQTTESASEITPAASNKKLKAAQTPISTLETMLLVYWTGEARENEFFFDNVGGVTPLLRKPVEDLQ